MICATRIIKPPPTRIATLGAGVTLPRTVPVRSAVAVAVGVLVGALVGTLFGSFQIILGTAAGFGAVGAFLATWSPVKGETLFQWIGVNVFGRARQRKMDWEGDSMALYVGVARLHRVALGDVRIFPGAVDVAEGSVDERGVLRSAKNRNEADSPARTVADLPGFTPLPTSPLPDRMVAGMGPGVVRRSVPMAGGDGGQRGERDGPGAVVRRRDPRGGAA